jgi:hypothetical protein
MPLSPSDPRSGASAHQGCLASKPKVEIIPRDQCQEGENAAINFQSSTFKARVDYLLKGAHLGLRHIVTASEIMRWE